MFARPCCTVIDLIGSPRLGRDADMDTLESVSGAGAQTLKGLDD